MRTLLLGFAAACVAITLPAGAQAQWRDSQGTVHRDHRDAGRFGHRHHGHDGSADSVFVTYGGEWAAYNNRSWDPDSYNDWWHDRPDRAYPRWVQEARQRGTCTPDRMWWSGTGWHC
jgi:hypothetical protein